VSAIDSAADPAANGGAAPGGGGRTHARLLGTEAVPLWALDDCHPDAAGLCEFAIRQEFARREGDYYPGLRAPVPLAYEEWVISMLRSGIENGTAAQLELLNCTYAIACDDPANLAPIQLIPHFDSTENDLIAAVHYLCAPPFAGTAFYRHRSTGFERIDATRVALFQQALAADARQFGLPAARYQGGSNQTFEQIGTAPLRFNRIVVYPANCLHSGMLDAAYLSSDPLQGRLTITTLARWISRSN